MELSLTTSSSTNSEEKSTQLSATLDAALPELRNLIALELARVSDPDRTEEELQEMKSKGAVLEAKKVRGPEIVSHL